MPDRNGNSGNYRYAFNGQENDNEIKGNGNSVDFGARIYDARLGRWLSRDPLSNKYTGLSAYNYCANNPLYFIDPNGKEIRVYGNIDGLVKYLQATFGSSICIEVKPVMITVGSNAIIQEENREMYYILNIEDVSDGPLSSVKGGIMKFLEEKSSSDETYIIGAGNNWFVSEFESREDKIFSEYPVYSLETDLVRSNRLASDFFERHNPQTLREYKKITHTADIVIDTEDFNNGISSDDFSTEELFYLGLVRSEMNSTKSESDLNEFNSRTGKIIKGVFQKSGIDGITEKRIEYSNSSSDDVIKQVTFSQKINTNFQHRYKYGLKNRTKMVSKRNKSKRNEVDRSKAKTVRFL